MFLLSINLYYTIRFPKKIYFLTGKKAHLERFINMEKETFKSGNMLYPLPVVMISCSDGEGHDNIITVAWAGTVCTNPPMLSISIRPERYSYGLIEKTKEFVVNLTTEDLAKATDFCGVRSGRNIDKFNEMKLTKAKGDHVNAPMILESPVNIECRVRDIIKLGSHDMFLADVLAVHVNKQLMNEKGKLELNRSNPIVYSHGEYYGIGSLLGTFGYSVKKEVQKKETKEKDKKREKQKDDANKESIRNTDSHKKDDKKDHKKEKKKDNKKDSKKVNKKREASSNQINKKDASKKDKKENKKKPIK